MREPLEGPASSRQRACGGCRRRERLCEGVSLTECCGVVGWLGFWRGVGGVEERGQGGALNLGGEEGGEVRREGVRGRRRGNVFLRLVRTRWISIS